MSPDALFALFVFAVGFVSSLFAGIVGVGAVLLIAPLLYFASPLLGHPIDFKAISNLTTFAVLVAAFRSIAIYRTAGLIRGDIVRALVIPAFIGSTMGVLISRAVSAGVVQAVFAIASIVGALILLLPYDPSNDDHQRQIDVNPLHYAALGGGVGVVGGLAGAGGGFLLVPMLLSLFRLPTRMALSSAAVSGTIIAIAAFVWRVALVPLDWTQLGAIGVGAFFGADVGTRLQFKVSTRTIRRALACVVGIAAVKTLLAA